MTAGRPRTYKPDMVEKARRYIANHEDFDDPVPTVAGLACVLGVTRKTVYEWSNGDDKPEFSDILEELAQKQERCLVRGGLMSAFNAPIAKMMLTKHGYSDRVDTDVTTNGKDLPSGVDLSKLSSEALAELIAARDAATRD